MGPPRPISHHWRRARLHPPTLGESALKTLAARFVQAVATRCHAHRPGFNALRVPVHASAYRYNAGGDSDGIYLKIDPRTPATSPPSPLTIEIFSRKSPTSPPRPHQGRPSGHVSIRSLESHHPSSTCGRSPVGHHRSWNPRRGRWAEERCLICL